MLLKVGQLLVCGALVSSLVACGGEEEKKTSPAEKPAAEEPAAAPAAPPIADDLDHGLMMSLSAFAVSPEGKVLYEPQPAKLIMVARRGGQWESRELVDPDSNVFHKAMLYTTPAGQSGVLTLGGTAAALKFWQKGAEPQTLWTKDFGGKFSRMRDAEVGDLFGEGSADIAVATHDQGVVALVSPQADGSFSVTEIDQKPNTFVHEIEIGDMDGDGTLEIYATPSAPNKMDGKPQPGSVVRYVPSQKGTETVGEGTVEGPVVEGPVVVADLGDRHAKEILVEDMDGDGVDELYVSIEEPTEIRRYLSGTDPAGGTLVTKLDDKLTRFLTAGDVDGDGKLELVAAGYKSGLWLLTPGANQEDSWQKTSIDTESGGFEHASVLTDLDGDGKDELYVASDTHGELRRYIWTDSGISREVIYKHEVRGSALVWNVMPIPVEHIPVEW